MQFPPSLIARLVIAGVVVFQDITALKELDRLREEWTSVIAHDLRQPLTVILGYIDLLQRILKREGYLEPVSEAIGHLRASAVHQQKMVSDLLDVARFDAHGGTIWAESIPGQETTFHFTVPV